MFLHSDSVQVVQVFDLRPIVHGTPSMIISISLIGHYVPTASSGMSKSQNQWQRMLLSSEYYAPLPVLLLLTHNQSKSRKNLRVFVGSELAPWSDSSRCRSIALRQKCVFLGFIQDFDG